MSAGRGRRRGRPRAVSKPHEVQVNHECKRRPKWSRAHREEAVLSWQTRPLRVGPGSARKVEELESAPQTDAAELKTSRTKDVERGNVLEPIVAGHGPSRDSSCATLMSSVSTSSVQAFPMDPRVSASNDRNMSQADSSKAKDAIDATERSVSSRFGRSTGFTVNACGRGGHTAATNDDLDLKTSSLKAATAYLRAYNALMSEDPSADREWLSRFAESHWPSSCEELWKWQPVSLCFKSLDATDLQIIQIPLASSDMLNALLASPADVPYLWKWLTEDAHELVQATGHARRILNEPKMPAASATETLQLLGTTTRAKHDHRRGIVCETCLLQSRLRAQQSRLNLRLHAEQDSRPDEPAPNMRFRLETARCSGGGNASGGSVGYEATESWLGSERSGSAFTHAVFFNAHALFPRSKQVSITEMAGTELKQARDNHPVEVAERSCDVCMSDEYSPENRLWRCNG